MNEKELSAEYLVKQIETLPELEQKAACWLITNIEIVDQLVEGDIMEKEKIEEYIKLARKRNDHVMFALASFKKIKDEHKTDKQENEQMSLKS